MKYQILANKWRPKSLDDIVGQAESIYTIKNIINSKLIHHAFLITGQHGTGKTTLARIITKCVNCRVEITTTPCNKCSCCIDIDNDSNIDSIEIDAASKTKVDEIKNVMDLSRYKNFQNRFKTYIIDECHMLSLSSFNSILKTLEEPKLNVIYILVTTNVERVPLTIISRCINLNLKKISKIDLKTRLLHIIKKEKFRYTENALDKITLFSDGSMRHAINILEKLNKTKNIIDKNVEFLFGLASDERVLLIIKNIYECNYHNLIAHIKFLSKENKDIKNILIQIQLMLHKISLYKVHIKYDKFISRNVIFLYLSNRLTMTKINVIYRIISQEKLFVKTSPDHQMFIEMLMLKIINKLKTAS